MSDVIFCSGPATDVGRVREVNEDRLLEAAPFFVVADGMGGHHGGDVASTIVVDRFAELAAGWQWEEHDAADARDQIDETLATCQGDIMEWSRQQGGDDKRSYAGTTAVVAVLVRHEGEPHWLVGNLGDSRAYRLATGQLEQVTVDHSLVQDLVDAGTVAPEDADGHPESHVVTRALGGPEMNEADYFLLPMPSLERLMLCTDGVTDMLPDETIREVLSSTGTPRDAANLLVGSAVEAGGVDNATALVVEVQTQQPGTRP